jgi:hypothetical protein
MKTTAKLVTLFLLVLTSSLKAQEEYISQEVRIQQAFEQIANAKGIEHSVNKYIERDEKAFDKVLEETEIHNFRIGRANFKLLDKLQEVFTSLESNNRLLSIYTDFNPIEYSTRQKWNIKTNKDAIIIGARPRSSYAIAAYQDSGNKDFRTVYAVEWWDTDDKDIRQGILVRTYGEKVQKRDGDINMRSLFSTENNEEAWKRYEAWRQKLQKGQRIVSGMADSTNIPFDGTSLKEWMNKAINGIGHLESDDWLRIFGLLTQQIEDAAESNSKSMTKEELVVASNLVLQLCKDAPIDDDEIEMCCKRLNFVAAKVSAHSMYVGDTLRLAMKRLRKE